MLFQCKRDEIEKDETGGLRWEDGSTTKLKNTRALKVLELAKGLEPPTL